MSSKSQDTLVIDPVKMNIVNRVAEGCVLDGQLRFEGGVLLQGLLRGSGEIAGRLVVWHTGQLQGRWRVLGDLYVLGRVGEVTDAVDSSTHVECPGTVFLAAGAISTGELMASRLRMYDGAVLQGPFTTLRSDRALPVLGKA